MMTTTSLRTFSIPRPSEANFRRLRYAKHGEIAQALDMGPDDFREFKVFLFLCVIPPAEHSIRNTETSAREDAYIA
jgi:hypothetical protein